MHPDRPVIAKKLPQQKHTLRVALMALAGAGGLLAIGVIIMFFLDSRSHRERHTFLAAAPVFPSGAPGIVSILEGRIAPATPPLRDSFVVWLREGYGRGHGYSSGWNDLDGQVQPLVIETATGPVRIVNNNYTLDRTLHAWAHETRDESAPSVTKGAVRISGLVPGRPVLAIGRPAPGGTPGEFQADSLIGIDRQTCLDKLTATQNRYKNAIIILSILAPLLLFYAVRTFRRVLLAP